jgi:hypothetical protein
MKVITAQNIKGNFFGGMPFDVNWSFGGSDSPSKLTINVVNESGEYGDPQNNLGFRSVSSISIGGFNFNGYLVSYQFKNSPDKKILELTYVDKSIDLDRYVVGLNNRWGKKSNNNAQNLILVGKAYHPCDQDLDSTVEYSEKEGQVDPCDPCSEMPPDKYENACDPVLADFNIFEVYYTFNELINEISNKFNCSFNGSEYINYKSNHIGPLRNVLSSWCSDLGLAFFWDPIKNELVFINRNQKIDIPSESSLKSISNIIDLEYGGSVENTFTQGVIGYFGRQGDVEPYTCEKSTLENLNCLTLGALAEDGTFNSGGGETGGGTNSGNSLKDAKDYQAKEIAVALSYYSLEMRDSILWFNHYGNYNAENLKQYIQSSNAGSGPSQGKLPPNTLSFFGNMEILAVYSADDQNQENKIIFLDIEELLTDNDIETLNLGISGPESRGTLENPNYYFFVARCNEELYEKERNREQELAQNFLGKFWIKDFDTTIPNASNSKTEVTVEAPDGNGSWYYKNSQLKNLKIFDFGHEQGSYISLLDDQIAETENEYDQNLNKYTTDEKEKEFIVKGFILHEREPKWFPDKDFAKWYQSLFDWYGAQNPRKFSQENGRPEILYTIFPESLNDPNIRLYIARKGVQEAYNITIETPDSTQHPKEPKKKPIKNEIEQDIFGDIQVKEICKFGLGEKSKYTKISVGKNNDIEIHTPPESFSNTTTFNESSGSSSREKVLYGEEAPEGSQTGYDVIATAKSNFQIYFPKFEYVKQISARNIDRAASVNYNYQTIQEDNVNYFRKNLGNKNSSTRSNCQINEQEVDKYINQASKFTHYQMTDVQNRASFRIAGAFPQRFGIEDGLASVSIIINDNGVFTDYTLEDKIIQPPNLNVLEQALKNFAPFKSLKNRGSIAPVNKTNIRKYRNAIRNV